MKTIQTPGHPTLTSVRFGRKRPVAVGLHMKLANYLKLSFPPAPAAADYSKPATTALANVMLNDQLGDCVIAGGYHIVAVETGNATGTAFNASDSQITKDYSAIGGYKPGDPNTDQGCDENTALAYWQNHGFANGTKILGSLTVDPTNWAEVQAALFLFENLVICMELPDAYVDPFPSGDGFTWGVAGASVPDNGHSIAGFGYNASGVEIVTWGMKGLLTKEALAKYAATSAGGSLNVILTPDQIAKGMAKAPNGIDWVELLNDFNKLGGHVPVPVTPPIPAPTPAPTPVPTPTPTPSPSSGPTLAEAQAWATADLAKQYFFLPRDQTIALVKASLAKHWPKS